MFIPKVVLMQTVISLETLWNFRGCEHAVRAEGFSRAVRTEWVENYIVHQPLVEM
jgi:hypothetical protein